MIYPNSLALYKTKHYPSASHTISEHIHTIFIFGNSSSSFLPFPLSYGLKQIIHHSFPSCSDLLKHEHEPSSSPSYANKYCTKFAGYSKFAFTNIATFAFTSNTASGQCSTFAYYPNTSTT